MARANIELGTAPTGVGGDTPRSAFVKINANFTELYNNPYVNYLRTASGPNVTLGQGGYVGWNEAGAGEMVLICNKGGGSGGFTFRTVNTDNTVESSRMTFSGAGLLTVPQLTVTNLDATRNNLGIGRAQAVEFGGLELFAGAPLIDFHFGSTAADYNVRLINDASQRLTCTGDFTSRGTICKAGVSAGAGTARYNFNWTGSVIDMWVDATYVGSVNTAASDYRLKKYIKDFVCESYLDRIDKYRIVSFQKKVFADVFKGDGTTYQGLIAHEAQAVNPLAATGEKDAVDAEGNPIIQQLETMALITDLMGAIKELRAQVIELQSQLNKATVEEPLTSETTAV